MHPEVGTGADQGLLDRPHVIDHVDRLAEPDDRVPDELPGAVPGDLAAAVDVDHRGSRVAGRPVELLGPLARRVDGRVLEQQAGVRDVAAHPPLVQVPLQIPGLLVGDRVRTEAGPGEYQLALHATSLRARSRLSRMRYERGTWACMREEARFRPGCKLQGRGKEGGRCSTRLS